MSSDASPRPRSRIRLSESEDYLDYEEDVTDSSASVSEDEDAFFANENERDCVGRGENTCDRLSHCRIRVNGNGSFHSCVEQVRSCSNVNNMSDKNNSLRSICNAAIEGRTNQLCRWTGGNSSNGRCGTSNNRITVRRTEDYVDYEEEDLTDSSEDYDYNDYDYYEEEEGEDSEDMFSTSEDYADSY